MSSVGSKDKEFEAGDKADGTEQTVTNEINKKRKKTSKVWDDFEEIVINDVKKAKCKHCGTHLSQGQSAATSHLGRHLKSCAAYLAFNSNKKGKNAPAQSLLSFGVDGNLGNYKFDKEITKDVMAKMMIVHEYPFMMAEHEFFNVLLKTLNPRFEPIKRRPIRNHCMKIHKIEKIKLKSMLVGVGKVSLTSDLWTSNQTCGYMCLTAHYVDSDWTLQSRLLNFCRLPPPHNGIAIADQISSCLNDWGLEDKVFTITLDNASANDSAVRCLKDELRIKGKLPFDGKIFHVRCCAHILNLLVQDGLSVITDIIYNVRESVKYITLTDSRLHKFNEIVTQISLKTKMTLILDVATRWNSTYHMLKRALVFKDVFPLYQKRDSSYIYLPSEDDWSRVANVCKFLEIFDRATNVFSGTKYPTSNLFFPEVWKIRRLLDEMSSSTEDYMTVMVLKMKQKFDKYWGDCSLLMAIGAALDPRNKLVFIRFVFEKLYPRNEEELEPKCEKKIDAVHEALLELYSDYASKALESYSTSGTSGVGGSGLETINENDEFEEWAKDMSVAQPNKNEMDAYIEEGRLKGGDNKFSVLDWWKANSLKFPILSHMARDILAILASTVASESSFSAGGRVLDRRRSSLKPPTVEALLCTGNWLRQELDIHSTINDVNLSMVIEIWKLGSSNMEMKWSSYDFFWVYGTEVFLK